MANKTFNIYFDMPSYCGGKVSNVEMDFVLTSVKNILDQGGEVTGIVEFEKDMGPV